MHESKTMTMHAEDVSVHDEATHAGLLETGIQLDAEERDMTLLQSVKHHKRVLFFCIGGIFAGALTGYDNIANSATLSMPAFLIYFGNVDPVTKSLYIPSIWTALWTSMGSLVQAIGGFLVAFIFDRFGRKWTMVGAGLLSAVGVAVQVTATSRASLLAGKLVNGLAMGAIQATSQTYVSEISPVRIRGPVQSALTLFSVLMLMCGLGIISIWIGDMSQRAFRLVFGLQAVWAAVICIIYPFLPESPVYLVNRGRPEAAHASLAKLHGKDNHINARLAHLRSTIQHENSAKEVETGSYADCFKGTDRRRTLLGMFILGGGNLCGACFLGQSIYFLFIVGMEPVNVFNISIGGFAFAAILIVASWFWIEKFGRRTIFLVGSSTSVVGLAIVGGLYYVPGKGALWGIAVLLTLLTAWQLLCLQSVSYAIVAELSSFKLRGKSLAVCTVFNTFLSWLFSFVTPYMYNIDSGNLGARTGFVWAGACLLYFSVSFFVVPETMATTTAEIDWLFENKVPARKFQERRSEATAQQQIALKEETV